MIDSYGKQSEFGYGRLQRNTAPGSICVRKLCTKETGRAPREMRGSSGRKFKVPGVWS